MTLPGWLKRWLDGDPHLASSDWWQLAMEQASRKPPCAETAKVVGKLWARLRYLERWPNYCRECNGIGIVGQQLSPLDGGGTEWDTCHDCEGTCPRCRYRFCDVDRLQRKWSRLANDVATHDTSHLSATPEAMKQEYWRVYHRVYNGYEWNSPSYKAWRSFNEGGTECPKCHFSASALGHNIAPPKRPAVADIREAVGLPRFRKRI